MYTDYFGLKAMPFDLVPDTARFAALEQYRDALSIIEYAVRSGQGVAKVTGEVGLGKTLLCRLLLNRLADECALAYLPNPSLDATAVLQTVARELKAGPIRVPHSAAVLHAISRRLIKLRAQGRRAVVVIDEAQGLSAEALEAVRLLANLETEQEKLLQIVLFGSPELDQHLRGYETRALRQRITLSYRLKPLCRQESMQYLMTRLSQAGMHRGVPFDGSALRRLAGLSHGVPRVINVLAHKTLLAALGRGAQCAVARDVDAAAADSAEQVGRWSGFWASIRYGLGDALQPSWALLVLLALSGLGVFGVYSGALS